MEKAGAIDKSERKAKKSNKSKSNKPLKVVYIDNPRKFTTSASEFRALVQGLTGQDADVAQNSADVEENSGISSVRKQSLTTFSSDSYGPSPGSNDEIDYRGKISAVDDDPYALHQMVDSLSAIPWYGSAHYNGFSNRY